MSAAFKHYTIILASIISIQLLKNELYEIISDRTGQPLEKVAADCERDYWMTSFEAKEYGAIDKIIGVD